MLTFRHRWGICGDFGASSPAALYADAQDVSIPLSINVVFRGAYQFVRSVDWFWVYCVLHIAYCVLCTPQYVLRIAYCVLRIAYYGVRIPQYVLRIAHYVLCIA